MEDTRRNARVQSSQTVTSFVLVTAGSPRVDGPQVMNLEFIESDSRDLLPAGFTPLDTPIVGGRVLGFRVLA